MTTSNNSQTAGNGAPAGADLAVDLVIDDEDRWCGLGDPEAIVQTAADAVAHWPGLLRAAASVSIALSTDAAVMALNTQYRGKAKPTNVLSFPAGRSAPEHFLGDIILAEETVAAEATEQGISLTHHVQHLVVHGLLHLLGYDHEVPADAERMEELEISLLAKLGIANPYAGELITAAKE